MTDGGGVYARWNISGNASGLGTKSDIKLVNSIVAGNGSGGASRARRARSQEKEGLTARIVPL